MVRRSWFALLVCAVLTTAGCQKAEPEPAPVSEPNLESQVPDDVDGQKVLDAMTSALSKAVADRAGQTPGAGGVAPPAP